MQWMVYFGTFSKKTTQDSFGNCCQSLEHATHTYTSMHFVHLVQKFLAVLLRTHLIVYQICCKLLMGTGCISSSWVDINWQEVTDH